MADCTDDFKGVTAERAAALLNALITEAKSDPSAVVQSKGKQTKGNRDNKTEGKSAAHFLSTSTSLSLLQSLLRHSPRVDCLDLSGMTPLTSALAANQNQAATALREAGALVDFCSQTPQKHHFNLTPLVFACQQHGVGGVNLIPAIKTMLERNRSLKKLLLSVFN